ncbi:WecB/TagA/CpsF family glycosyltransferase [Microbacterium yannicii]|uniref:WecB/TagA/CpsF family glycosyltransferase n=1 Tax=Microbacterium yannicii TaxID=671622 RepID=UPI0002FF188B|nr:WecB/TagA/CpsF family glycosyltransferase [Microbacterium yannicii]
MVDTTNLVAEEKTPLPGLTDGIPSISVDGVVTHLPTGAEALEVIAAAAMHDSDRPLGVASVNLDHIHHFGVSRRRAHGLGPVMPSGRVEWLALIDGTPIEHQATRMTGAPHPKLSGSDLIDPILDEAAQRHQRLGVIGGFEDIDAPLRARFASEWPGLELAGHWMPERTQLASPLACRDLAGEIRHAEIDILLVCLGKPRQEDWIDLYGDQTGAGVMLAFGAVANFLAGHDSRAPAWVSHAGLEWTWRLAHDPGRLARRYLVEGPPAYAAVRRSHAA